MCADISAQTLSYRIDTLARDSFFLVETSVSAATKDNPRPATTESSQLFRSKEQVVNFVDYLRKQAADSQAKAKEFIAAQRRLESAATLIEGAVKQAAPFFEDKPKEVVKPIVKTKTKTKKKG